MNRRLFLQSSAATVSLAFLGSNIGCGKGINQAQLAALAQTLGNSVANLAVLLNQNDTALKIQTITAQVVIAIQNYKPGDATSTIIQLLSDLEMAINLIPVSPQIQALITLALGTIQGILAFFPSAGGAVSAKAVGVPQVKLAKVPKTSKDYADQWNSNIAPDGRLAKARIQ